jgi:hypothetical protein
MPGEFKITRFDREKPFGLSPVGNAVFAFRHPGRFREKVLTQQEGSR